ncbi:MAG TPA: polysaccharide biosynthesis/export family protein, partial [Bacteroidota bacterium]
MKQYGSILVGLMVVFLWATPSRTQTTQGTGLSSLKSGVEQFDVRNLLGRGVTLPTFPSVPLQEAIDPKKYVVGPSDIFSVNIWLGTGFSYQSAVTPEGSLIIPTVGEVRVAGSTLAEAKRRTVERVRKTYADGEITVTLVSPRTFVVYVTGLVAREGPYVVTAITRVDQVVSLANIPVDTAMVAQA